MPTRKQDERVDPPYYLVVFKQRGVGSIYHLATRKALDEKINDCIERNLPFHVGHEFKMTLSA